MLNGRSACKKVVFLFKYGSYMPLFKGYQRCNHRWHLCPYLHQLASERRKNKDGFSPCGKVINSNDHILLQSPMNTLCMCRCTQETLSQIVAHATDVKFTSDLQKRFHLDDTKKLPLSFKAIFFIIL